MSEEKARLRAIIRGNLPEIIATLNAALRGEGLDVLEGVIARIAKGGQLPHWYQELKGHHTIANLDGKTIGSILEMLIVAVMETGVLSREDIKLRVNPARGIDLPDLDLGIKSPSRNYCTSEPFFSAYERLYGNDCDCIVLLTDYQDAKKAKENFKIQVTESRYLFGSEIADQELCRIARGSRDWLLAEDHSTAKRVFRFLAFVNQADWRARWLLKLLDEMATPKSEFDLFLERIEKDYSKQNADREKKDRDPIPENDILSLRKIFEASPSYLGVIHQLDNWVTEFLKEASRPANDNEWERLIASPLNGKIGMSFALQWRYNFGKIFGDERVNEDVELEICEVSDL